jgi:hypothetical protein
VEEEVIRPLLYWDTEEVVERADVLHHELLLEICSGILEKLRAWGGEDDVVDIEQQISGVWLGLQEAQQDHVGDEAMVPCSRHLLQAIEGLVELAHQLRVSSVNEAGGLRAVDHLRECAVEEGILDVELVDGPTSGDSQSQHSPDGGRLDDGAEGLIIVHLGALGEPPEDPTSLVPVQRAIRLELVLEDPLTSDNVGPRRLRNQVPCAVRQQGLVLIHSVTPVGVRERTTDRG